MLTADGDAILRADGFAQFTGAFMIGNPAGSESFRGSIVLLDRIGTHQPPFGTEPCNERQHVEGWLIGRGSPRFPNHTIRALIVARGFLVRTPKQTVLEGSFNGSLTKCP